MLIGRIPARAEAKGSYYLRGGDDASWVCGQEGKPDLVFFSTKCQAPPGSLRPAPCTVGRFAILRCRLEEAAPRGLVPANFTRKSKYLPSGSCRAGVECKPQGDRAHRQRIPNKHDRVCPLGVNLSLPEFCNPPCDGSTPVPLPLRAIGRRPSPAPTAQPLCVLGESLQAVWVQAERDLPAQSPSPSLSQGELAGQHLWAVDLAATVVAHMLLAPNQSHSGLPRSLLLGLLLTSAISLFLMSSMHWPGRRSGSPAENHQEAFSVRTPSQKGAL